MLPVLITGDNQLIIELHFFRTGMDEGVEKSSEGLGYIYAEIYLSIGSARPSWFVKRYKMAKKEKSEPIPPEVNLTT